MKEKSSRLSLSVLRLALHHWMPAQSFHLLSSPSGAGASSFYPPDQTPDGCLTAGHKRRQSHETQESASLAKNNAFPPAEDRIDRTPTLSKSPY